MENRSKCGRGGGEIETGPSHLECFHLTLKDRKKVRGDWGGKMGGRNVEKGFQKQRNRRGGSKKP